jgi:hypothetical protein
MIIETGQKGSIGRLMADIETLIEAAIQQAFKENWPPVDKMDLN